MVRQETECQAGVRRSESVAWFLWIKAASGRLVVGRLVRVLRDSTRWTLVSGCTDGR